MNREDLSFFEDLLVRERRRLLDGLGTLGEGMNQTQRESSGDLSAYSVHMADQATDAMEREKSFYIASIEGQALAGIDRALDRLRKGNFGLCTTCKEEIARERLEALPGAELCIACQEKQEATERNGMAES